MERDKKEEQEGETQLESVCERRKSQHKTVGNGSFNVSDELIPVLAFFFSLFLRYITINMML